MSPNPTRSPFRLLTKDQILFYCRFARTEKSIYREFGIVVGVDDNARTNKRYELRYFSLKQNPLKKGYLTESDGKLLTVKGDHARRNPAVAATQGS